MKAHCFVLLALLLLACQPAPQPGKPPLPTTVGQIPPDAVVTPQPPLPVVTPVGETVVVEAAPARLQPPLPPGAGQPTLADFWAGRARWAVETAVTGLPLGESDTILLRNGEMWSYLHASQRSAGAVDQCGDPVPFPGCTVIYRSFDGGHTFAHDDPPVCQFACRRCPCDADRDHMVQQQYPRVFYDGERMALVYEYLGRVMLRRSADGLTFTPPQRIAHSTIWKLWWRDCPAAERIGEHPFVPYDYECLVGGPPGVYVEEDEVYLFMAVGQNPGGMGCYRGHVAANGAIFEPCAHNPLIVGAAEYGPLDVAGAAANPFFDFRTISSAEVIKLDDRYYMLYEGIRGPGPGDPGDSQFGLGLARSLTDQIDGPWEKFPGNPLLLDLPGNIGLGHADLVVLPDGSTILYTSLDGVERSRLRLVGAEVEYGMGD